MQPNGVNFWYFTRLDQIEFIAWKKVCIIRSQRYKDRSMMRVIISFLFQVLSTVLIVGLGYSSLWLSFFYKLYIGHHIFIYFNKYTFPFIYLLLYKIYMVIIFLYILINVLLIKINYLYFNVFKRDFLSGCYDQISEFFLLRKFGVFILIYKGL